MIKALTITGSDDLVAYSALVSLQEQFPFLEFGILFNDRNQHGPRFPSMDWICGLPFGLNLSLHLCGKPVRQAYMGKWSDIDFPIGFPITRFARCQLNTHGEKHTYCDKKTPESFSRVARQNRWQIIQQIDNVNPLYLMQESITGLFDLSHGAGLLPEYWPSTLGVEIADNYIGYAGGLSPDNLELQIPKILKAARKVPIWLDIESGVRTNNQLDLVKVIYCAEVISLRLK